MSDIKYIAWYLPQFHRIPENDQWWGEGFTEWTNVKNAKPRYSGHNQPRIPKDKNYYSLDKVETLEWQASLMKKYNIFGLCFYHYWFKDGKKLLEKPAEILLNNPTLDMNFCFSWANEPWTRSWDGKSGETIMPQEYGGIKEWTEHFEYLLPFFLDKRYILIENKPVFVIYKSEQIPNLDKMMELWDKLAKDNGIAGIYFINTLRNNDSLKKSELFEANVEFEPFYSTGFTIKGIDQIRKRLTNSQLYRSYDSIVKKSLKQQPIPNQKTIPGLFVDWDNTPRKDPAFIFKGFTPSKFEQYVEGKIDRAIEDYNSPYLFINAWNEWAEGTYLEPDEKYGYSVLEILKKVRENK